MKSSVENYVNYQQIPVPEDKLTIEIPSWEAVAKPMVDLVLQKYNQQYQTEVKVLTDEMVKALNLPQLKSLHQVKQYGMDVYIQNLSFMTYHEEVLPWILTFYKENTNTIMDRQEKEDYVKEYIQSVRFFAEAKNLSLETYAKDILKLKHKPIEALTRRALEDFTFKLIAIAEFDKQGVVLDDIAYEEFIQKNVLHKQIDEIELRDEMPLKKFQQMMPEMALSEDMRNYYVSKMTVKINPDMKVRRFD